MCEHELNAAEYVDKELPCTKRMKAVTTKPIDSSIREVSVPDRGETRLS